MKKTYFAPAMQVNEVQAENLMAVSLQISDKTVSGDEALSRESADWDIWTE